MTNATNDWTGDAARGDADPTKAEPLTHNLVADSGDRTPPTPSASLSEGRTFDQPGNPPPSGRRAAGARTDQPGLSANEQESLLRASLETIRVKAEEIRGQAKDWTQVRSEQARQAIDGRPLTAVAAAFGAGLVLGALLSR